MAEDRTYTANISGFSNNLVTGVETDLWDLANDVDNIPAYLAPTEEQGHNVSSTSSIDTGTGGGGARIIELEFLRSWDERAIKERITMDGTTDVPMINNCVVINTVTVIEKGAITINDGGISVTAEVDGTVSAFIQEDVGQTKMGIFGVPSVQIAKIIRWRASIVKMTGADTSVLIGLLINPNPDEEPKNFFLREQKGLFTGGSSEFDDEFDPPIEIPGPALIKVRGILRGPGSAEASGGFDVHLRDK